MRILITNDDGITAPGLAVIEAIAADLAGPDGEVWVVAPAFEQSGVSHCISYIRPMMLQKMGERRYAVEGSPADCVLAGLFEILKDSPPDLILSGVNRGHNVAEDTLYSGTIGGAIEATLHGHKAIAMSQYYSRGNALMEDPFEAARVHGADICRQLIAGATWNDQPTECSTTSISLPFRQLKPKASRLPFRATARTPLLVLNHIQLPMGGDICG